MKDGWQFYVCIRRQSSDLTHHQAYTSTPTDIADCCCALSPVPSYSTAHNYYYNLVNNQPEKDREDAIVDNDSNTNYIDLRSELTKTNINIDQFARFCKSIPHPLPSA